MKNQTKKFSTIIILSLLALLTTSAVYAQDGNGKRNYVNNGTYLGVYLTKNNMSGDFDGSGKYYTTTTELFDVPDLDDGSGFGFVLGHRDQKAAVELGYQRSRHDTSSFFIDMGENDASYNVIDFNFKVDIFARNKVRPYILFGFGIPWLTIEDRGMIDLGSYEDITYMGWALNAGAGAAYYFRPQWAVTGGLMYRWNWFTRAEGASLDESLFEKAFCFNIGVAYTF
jgi:hypothetical protein